MLENELSEGSDSSRTRTRALVAVLFVILMVMSTVVLIQGDEIDVSASEGNQYNVIGEVDYATLSNINQSGDTITATLRANSGYAVPQSTGDLYIVGGTLTEYRITSDSVAYLEITATSSSGIIRVEGSALKMVPVYLSTSPSSTTSKYAIPGEELDMYLPSKTGYDYPDRVSVAVSGSTLSSSYYTYSSSTGHVTVDGNRIGSNATSITIYGDYVPKEYKVTGNITNGHLSYTGNPTYGGSFSISIEPDAGHDYPTSVTVRNGSTNQYYSYNQEYGEIRITDVRGDITITATCAAGVYNIIYHDGNETVNMYPSTYTFGEGRVLPTVFEKDMYIFQGWRDSGGNPITAIPTTSFGDVHVYAVFIDDMAAYGSKLSFQAIFIVIAVIGVLATIGLMYYSRR